MHTSQTSRLATTLIIVGITGDLSRRKLLPAIANIAAAGALPQNFKVIGITRQERTVAELLAEITLKPAEYDFLIRHLELYQMRLEAPEDYTNLAEHLAKTAPSQTHQRLFYLSVPPQVSQPIVRELGASGLAAEPHTKLLLEKPFGSDLVSAQELITETREHFTEENIYRIDHYLAKEMAQDIIVFRTQNSLFRQTWNGTHIEAITITASESIGIEGRAHFYEQTGALRDVIQGHLLQLAALILMETPAQSDNWQQIPALRLKALQQLHINPANISHDAVRAQYDGYKEEAGSTHTTTETFTALTLASHDPRWKNVPIRLITGKALAQKYTEITIHYHKEDSQEANVLRLRIQPEEGIELIMWAKKPGYTQELVKLPLGFSYQHHYEKLPEAYEQVIIDAIRSSHSLFTASDEVLAAWQILAPVQEYWEMHNNIRTYKKGSNITDIL